MSVKIINFYGHFIYADDTMGRVIIFPVLIYRRTILFYSILFYSILFYSILLYSIVNAVMNSKSVTVSDNNFA